MIVITKNAETELRRYLDRLYADASVKRCLHFSASQIEGLPSDWFAIVSEEFENISDGNMGQMYIMMDQDLFVIYPHLSTKHVEKLSASLAERLCRNDIMIYCQLYEVVPNHSVLVSVINEKIKTLPLYQAAQQADQPKASELIAHFDQNRVQSLAKRRAERREISILLVEDDALIRMMVKNVLVHDFFIQTVEDGKSALTSYAELAPDVVFLDIGLPDISGHDILNAIATVDPDCYIIMFSSRKDRENMLRAMRAGASGFVGKPFTRGKLFHYIEQGPSVIRKKLNGVDGISQPIGG